MANETTTKFKVDISELKKNIQDANRQIKLANAEFKAAASGMDDWQKSTDGVQKKIENLQSVLGSQKTVLEAYKKQLQLITEEYGENSREADEMRIKIANQQTVVNNTERSLRDYTSTLQQLQSQEDGTTDSTNNLDDSLNNVNDDADKASSGGLSAFAVAIGNLASNLIQAAIDKLKELASTAKESFEEFDKGRDIIIAKTGAVGDAADEMIGIYTNLSKTVAGSTEDIASAVGELNTRFGLTGKDLEKLSEKFIKFTKLNGGDVSSSIDDVQKALSAFGLSADYAEEYLDILNKVGQDTGVSFSTLTKGIIQNGTAFSEMGLSIGDASALMGQMEKSGANSETVMNGLRKALKSATNDGIPLKEALISLEDSIVNNKDSVKGLEIAYDAFGKSGDQIYGALKNGTLSFKGVSLSAQEYSDSIENTYENTMDASDKIKLAYQGMRASIGETVDQLLKQYGPEIEKAIQKVVPVIQNAITWIAENVPKAIEGIRNLVNWIIENSDAFVIALSSMAAAVGAYLAYTTAVTVMTEGWAALTIVTKAQAAAQAVLNAVMSANPIGLVIAAIAALVTAFILLWNKSEKFREFWIGLWNSIQEVAIKDIEILVKFFAVMWDKLSKGAKAAWEGIKNAFGNVADWFKDVFSKAWENVKKVFSVGGQIFSGIKEGIVNAFKAVVNAIIRGINTVIAVPFNAINGILDKIQSTSILGFQPFEDLVFRLNVPQIPELARGGILRKGQVGLLEGNGSEAVVPLDQNKKWIAATAAELRNALIAEGVISAGGVGGEVVTNYNFIQNNTSPKALSRLDIYRQSKNLFMMGAT